MRRTVAALTLTALCALTGCTGTDGPTVPATPSPTALDAPTRAYEPPARPTVTAVPAAPTTAAGFTALWATIDPDQWGGADVSLSAPLTDGRVVWLYGDTLSRRHGMVHSTGITQHGGSLHVSRAGTQLLPDDPDGTVYWIEAAHESAPGVLTVTAAPIRFGTSGAAWDFHRARTRSRLAHVTVDQSGDLTFTRWAGTTEAPAPFTDLAVHAGGHVTYEHRAHPEQVLASGATLWTVNHNWTRGFKLLPDGTVDYAAYRPTFYESDARADHTQR